MKKIIIGSLISLIAISTTLNASSDTKANMSFSGGSIAIDTANPNGSIGYSLDWGKKTFGDLYLGLGINGEIFRSNYPVKLNPTNKDADLGIILDVYPLMSYYFNSKFSINGLYSYTVGELGSETFDGATYGFGAQYKISKNWGAGVNYKMSNIEFTSLKEKMDIERYNANIFYRF